MSTTVMMRFILLIPHGSLRDQRSGDGKLGKKTTTRNNRVGGADSRCYPENMTDRPNSLTIHLSDDELAFLEMSAHRMRTLAVHCDPETAPPSMLHMTPSLMAVMLVEMALSQFLKDQEAEA